MDIKNKPTLQEKQAFWAEQLPNFEAKYWLPSHFELLEFDMEGGNYEVRDVLPEHYSEDDASDIYHRVNTGWAMWKKAINFTKAQVPESNALLSAAMDAVQKLGSGDFVLIRKKDFESLGEFKDLYKRAIISTKKRKNQINWAHVAGLGVGSGRAVDLCKSLGIDPGATNMHVVIEAQENE